jgi:hypothetical protein
LTDAYELIEKLAEPFCSIGAGYFQVYQFGCFVTLRMGEIRYAECPGFASDALKPAAGKPP